LHAEELIPLIKNADALVVDNDPVPEDVIDGGKKVKIIFVYGIGYDNIDLNLAKKKENCYSKCFNTSNNPVTELVMILITCKIGFQLELLLSGWVVH